MDSARSRLEAAIIECYGEQCRDKLDIIIKRLEMTIAGVIFFGNQGDTPCAKLNKLYEDNNH